MAVSLVAAPEMAVGQGNVRCNWIKLDDAFGNGELQENGHDPSRSRNQIKSKNVVPGLGERGPSG